MENISPLSKRANTLLNDFLLRDDLKKLAFDAGILLDCPLLVLDDAFRVIASYCPEDFSDNIFQDAIEHGEITYEAGAIISQSEELCQGNAADITLEGSPFRRRFVPLINANVHLGYLICVEKNHQLQTVSDQTWQTICMILAKQLFVETCRKDRPFETTEDILMHLLDGNFSSASYFRLQAANTYLANFHPTGFALIDLTGYRNIPSNGPHLKDEITSRFPGSHAFLYRGDIFLFLHKHHDYTAICTLAEEFHLKMILSDPLQELFELPIHYPIAKEALSIISTDPFYSNRVYSIAQLRTVLLLKSLEGRYNLITPALCELASYDRKKQTQYCETLYQYLMHDRSLKNTGEAMFTHRNTILYRIRKIQEDFSIPINDPDAHTEILLGLSMLLFRIKGSGFFVSSH